MTKKSQTVSCLQPSFVLDLHAICNQKCPYCVARDPWDGTFGALSCGNGKAAVERFFLNYGPFNVILTGGEPMITPGIESFLHTLISAGHNVSLQTNLRSGIEQFQRAVPHYRTGWILTTLHSVAFGQSHVYASKVRKLRQAGYPVVVKLILDQPTLDKLEYLYDLLLETGAGVLLSPLVLPEADLYEIPVMQYSKSNWQQIAPRINLLSSWLFFSGGIRSKGINCFAGSQAFYGRLGNHGSIWGCAHSFPDDLGDIMENRFSPLGSSLSCGLDRCCCDFNTYTGIVSKLDDRHGFDRLRKGKNLTVSRENFFQWIKRAGLSLSIDLTEVTARI